MLLLALLRILWVGAYKACLIAPILCQTGQARGDGGRWVGLLRLLSDSGLSPQALWRMQVCLVRTFARRFLSMAPQGLVSIRQSTFDYRQKNYEARVEWHQLPLHLYLSPPDRKCLECRPWSAVLRRAALPNTALRLLLSLLPLLLPSLQRRCRHCYRVTTAAAISILPVPPLPSPSSPRCFTANITTVPTPSPRRVMPPSLSPFPRLCCPHATSIVAIVADMSLSPWYPHHHHCLHCPRAATVATTTTPPPLPPQFSCHRPHFHCCWNTEMGILPFSRWRRRQEASVQFPFPVHRWHRSFPMQVLSWPPPCTSHGRYCYLRVQGLRFLRIESGVQASIGERADLSLLNDRDWNNLLEKYTPTEAAQRRDPFGPSLYSQDLEQVVQISTSQVVNVVAVGPGGDSRMYLPRQRCCPTKFSCRCLSGSLLPPSLGMLTRVSRAEARSGNWRPMSATKRGLLWPNAPPLLLYLLSSFVNIVNVLRPGRFPWTMWGGTQRPL